MADDELGGISVGEFETVSHLLASSESLQMAFLVMIIGIIVIIVVYRKLSSWVGSHKFYYHRPHLSRFIRKAILPVFAIALITTINVYVQTGILLDAEDTHMSGLGSGDQQMSATDTFTKILNTFNILVIGYTVSHLVPIALTKREKTIREKDDFDAWFDMRGFRDDAGDLFHKMYKWTPPKSTPDELEKDDFEKLLSTKDGVRHLEQFRTAQGNPIGGYEKQTSDPFEMWKKSERVKYVQYYENCLSGANQSGRSLRPNAKPTEIFSIDVWRDEKRDTGYEPVVPSARPPGYAEKKRKDVPKSTKQVLSVGIFAATILGVVGWWGVDLIVVATATGGFSIGLGLALQETMENYFAYIRIRKDKIFVEGDRVQLDTGYNGYVHKITPMSTYVRNAIHESIAIIPTKQMVTAQIINYTKENKLVPAVVKVGVSYLNDPEQVTAILNKVGERGMREITDLKGRHLTRQNRCPYLDENKQSCGCDKDLHVDITQPAVRFTNFNDSSLDFSLWLYVKDYGSQFRATTRLRLIMYEEFKKYDIRIPWAIRTIYQGDESKEVEEIDRLNPERESVKREYGLGDLARKDS